MFNKNMYITFVYKSTITVFLGECCLPPMIPQVMNSGFGICAFSQAEELKSGQSEAAPKRVFRKFCCPETGPDCGLAKGDLVVSCLGMWLISKVLPGQDMGQTAASEGRKGGRQAGLSCQHPQSSHAGIVLEPSETGYYLNCVCSIDCQVVHCRDSSMTSVPLTPLSRIIP